MKIYAIDNKNEEYDEWKDYVTEYKSEMIPNLEQKQWPTTEEYLANQDRINEYVKTNYGQEVINQVLDLYRKLTPISHIGKKLGSSMMLRRILAGRPGSPLRSCAIAVWQYERSLFPCCR